jgi:glycine betaine catabolism B
MLSIKSVNFGTQQFQKHDLQPHRDQTREWIIGRSPSCDIVLDCPEISRTHGRIIYSDQAYHFLDVGSTCGSILNGELVQVESPYPLRIGDLLQLGETFIYVEAVEDLMEDLDRPTMVLSSPGQPAWTNQDVWCRCDRIIQETADVRTFCLVAEPPIALHYLPGQFVTLAVEIDGKPVLRPYSISSTPSRPHHLTVTIKRVPSGAPEQPVGLVSNWMHNYFQVGDRLKLVGGPMGTFTCLPQLPEKMLLISAGSGITPMLSMSRWVQDTIAASDILFLHSARQPEDIVCRSELNLMAAQMPNFRLAVTLTQAAASAWMGLTGRISAPMLNLIAPDLMERSVFVCGPNAFMQHVKDTLETMGFPMTQYQAESFGGAPAAPKSTPVGSNSAVAKPRTSVPSVVGGNDDGTVTAAIATLTAPTAIGQDLAITFKVSGQTASSDGSLTVLAAAESIGVSLRSACRMGSCGACKVETCGAKVRYEGSPAALAMIDPAGGEILACVAYPVEPLTIEA